MRWNKQRRPFAVYISIGLIALLAGIYVISLNLRDDTNVPHAATLNTPTSPISENVPKEILLEQNLPITESPVLTPLALQGVMYSVDPRLSSALVQVNGESPITVQIGDFIAPGTTILEIGKDFVTFGNDEQREIVKLNMAQQNTSPTDNLNEIMAPGFRPYDAATHPNEAPLPNGNIDFREAVKARFKSQNQ